MPFKSKAQRLKFLQKVMDGGMTPEQFEEWDKDTPKNIPERIHKKLPAEVKPAEPIKPMQG